MQKKSLSAIFKQMKQKVFIVGVFLALIYGGLQIFKTPEKYLLKKTKHLIHLGSKVDSKFGLSLASKVSEINKYVHYDIRLKAEYEGRVYQARSLNEFRSLLMGYFKAGVTQKAEYENLIAELKDEKTGEVSFSIAFHNTGGVWACKVLLNWIKDKKWFIKNISIEKLQKDLKIF